MDRTRSLRAGFQIHLTKPIQPTELTAAVSALARGRQELARGAAHDNEDTDAAP